MSQDPAPRGSKSNDDDPGVLVRMPSNPANTLDGERNKEEQVSDESQTDSAKEEEFKEGGYGWVVVACVSLINAHTWGLNSSYAVFLAYYLRSGTIEGASPLAFAFVGGLSISMAFVVSPLVTWVVRLYGTRAVLLLGTLLVTLAFIGASFSSKMWHLLLSQGVAFGLGMGFCFVGTAGVVPQWFKRRRSLATAFSTAGSGFGGLTYSLATDAMITNIGLPWAFRILAIIAFVVNGTCSLLMRDRNKALGSVLVTFNKAVFTKPEYWLLLAWSFFSIIAYIIVVFSLADYAQDVGFTAQQGSIVAAMFNLSQGLGRPIIGYISDPCGRINVASLGTLYAGLAAFLLWTFAGKFFAGCVMYALMGVFAGIVWPVIAPLAVEVVGISLLPSALSATWLLLVPPGTCAEAIALTLRKSTGDKYINVQVFTGAMYMVAFVCILLLRSWKIDQLEQQRLTEGRRQMEIRDNDAGPALPQAEGAPAEKRSMFTPFTKHIFTIATV